jgi:hypothetical protein
MNVVCWCFSGGGEKWDGTHCARPCQIFSEDMKENIDRVYRIC